MEDSGTIGESSAPFIPRMQLDNYQVILNTLEFDLKTGRTNSTTQDREEVTSKKLGNAEALFGGERDCIHCDQEGAVVSETD